MLNNKKAIMSNFKIVGSINPEIGKEEFYTIDSGQNSIPSYTKENEPSKSNPFEEQVHWTIKVLQHGKWYPREKNNKTGKKVSYTFRQISLNKEKIRITAQIGEQKATLDVKPHPTLERKILSVDLCDALGNKQTKPFGYNQTIMARVHCLNLDYCSVHVTLWEDDAPGKGHSAINKNNKVITLSAVVQYGMAEVKFRLSPDFIKIANAGKNDEGKTHEYYVTAEIFRQETKSSNNINVINPDHKDSSKTPPTKPTVAKKQVPAESKGESKKDNKGIAKPSENKTYDWWETTVKVLSEVIADPIDIIDSLMKVNVGDLISSQKKGVCACKENSFYWSNKLNCDERKKVLQVCANIWGEDKKKDKASELMAIMHLETIRTFSPSKKGVSASGTKYIGLIQFSATTAKNIGTTYEALEKMTFIEQMDYVEKYLKQNKDKMKTLVDFYLQVIKPSDVGKGDQPNHAVFDESITVPDGDGSNTSKEQRLKNITIEPWVTKYGYASNPTFMIEKDEKAKRKKWVYTRQQFEDRAGYNNGKTTIKEIDDVLRSEHYSPGARELFNGKCENIIDDKKEEILGERAPWMDIAISEAKSYGGKKEGEIDSRIQIYHSEGGSSPGSGSDTAWCSSFVCWCLKESNYESPKSAGSRLFLTSTKVEKCDAFYGAVAIFSDCDSTGTNIQSSGHATFIFGELEGKNIYACLGGNQGDMLKMSKYDCSGNAFVSYRTKKKVHYKIFRGFYKPKSYIIEDKDQLSNTDKFSSEDEASKKALNLNIKTSTEGESSR